MAADKTVRALLKYAIERFERAGLAYGHGTTNALDEAAWLILHALGLPPHELDPHLDEPLGESQFTTAKALVERRVRTRKPAAYLIHEAWLGKHRFYVDERVIVPRSFIAELLLKRPMAPFFRREHGGEPMKILDLCTGSGCLAILVALRFPAAKVDGADLSDEALEVAKRNVGDYKLGQRIRLLQSDLFSALEGRAYDLIVSNPPYVKAASMKKLPEEYRKEPEMALASGADGLEHTRTILAGARRHLSPGGRLVVEIGHNRKALEKAFPKLPFEWPRTSGGKGFVFALKREDLPSPPPSPKGEGD
jgi:ribosomal protein L3 glutamine methyltransferase